MAVPSSTPLSLTMGCATFPSSSRLVRSEQFRRVFDKNVRSRDNFFTVLCSPNNKSHPRLGLAISRKAVAKAVQRNRLKRLVRESFRLSQDALPAVDLVVMARPGAGAARAEALRASLARHWDRVRRGTNQ